MTFLGKQDFKLSVSGTALSIQQLPLKREEEILRIRVYRERGKARKDSLESLLLML